MTSKSSFLIPKINESKGRPLVDSQLVTFDTKNTVLYFERMPDHSSLPMFLCNCCTITNRGRPCQHSLYVWTKCNQVFFHFAMINHRFLKEDVLARLGRLESIEAVNCDGETKLLTVSHCALQPSINRNTSSKTASTST